MMGNQNRLIRIGRNLFLKSDKNGHLNEIFVILFPIEQM